MKFDWIVNKLKERIYPYTHADAVIMDDNNTKLSEKFDNINSHIDDENIHIPSGGEIGQVLTKTAVGNSWTTSSGGGGEGGTTDYNLLDNLPKINDVTLSGNKSSNDLGINEYVHPITSGNKHIPSGGVDGQILKWSADGTAVWDDNDAEYSDATTDKSGLLSSTDKTKLDGIEVNANNYTHPTSTSKKSGLYKISVNNEGHVNNATAVTKDDIVSLGIPSTDTNTTYSIATHANEGLMSKEDKIKIDSTPNIVFSTVVPTELPENTICFVYEEMSDI